MKKKCACCGYYTLSEPVGGFDICPVCFWEDDKLQNADETLVDGANRVSLLTAKDNFIAFGACERRYINYVRKPQPYEREDIRLNHENE